MCRVTDVVLVANPAKVEDVADLAAELGERLAAHGWPAPRLVTTTPQEPGRGLAEQAAREGADLVLAAGGDGTVASVVSGLVGTSTALAVFPAGTGNLLARNLDLPMDLDGLVACLVHGRTRTIDVGEVLEGPGAGANFAVMAGVGFDAAIMEDAPERLKAMVGWPAYLVAAASHLADEPFECTIVVDGGEPIVREARTVLVANAASLQGGVELAPDAGVTDGLIDIIILGPRTVSDWLRVGARLATGSQREDERLERTRGRRVEITTDADEVAQLDGDPVGPTRRLVVEVRPRALHLRVPPD
jgi:diacylglycerol kinase (ATP)